MVKWDHKYSTGGQNHALLLGSFYWVLILIAFVICVAALYRKLHNGVE